jgi:hypothetical protein
MTTERTGDDRRDDPWDRVGRAAEVFARRMARDARTFAERIEEHAGDFARDVWREWPCGGGRHRRHRDRERAAPDVRGIFEDVRGILSDVAEGVDELIARLFPEAAGEPWARVVANRDAVCGGCGSAIAAGAEAHVRRSAGGAQFRCLACGVPGA